MVAAWPAVALVGSFELPMVIIRSAQAPTGSEVAAGRVPSVHTIRAWLHVGQVRAQRVRAYLTALINA
jgi:hypothetical protein